MSDVQYPIENIGSDDAEISEEDFGDGKVQYPFNDRTRSRLVD